MNQSQKKYAIHRLDQIAETALSAIRKKHETDAVRLTSKQRIAALKKGKFKFNYDRILDSRYGGFYSFVSIEGETNGSIDKKAIEKETTALNEALQVAKDEVMLGDSQKAMKMIESFSTKFG